MLNRLLNFIRSRSRAQWEAFARECWTDVRIWIQEHGEASLLLGAVFGFLVFAAFKFIFFLLAAAALLCFLVWYISEAQISERLGSGSGPSVNGHGTDRSDIEPKDG